MLEIQRSPLAPRRKYNHTLKLTDYSNQHVLRRSNSLRSSQDLLIDFDHPSGPSATRCSDLSTPIDDQHFLPVHSPGCHAHPRHERIMGLGASIPEELFEHILFHVGYNYIHDSPFWTFALVDPGNKAQDIKACSLVCRHWANQCRRHMFT